MYNKNIKKYYVICIALMFLVLGIFPSINAEIDKSYMPNIDISKKISKEIFLYKIDIQGQVIPVEAEIILKPGKAEEDIIAEKCKELCENDEELQKYINSNSENPVWLEVESKGKGFHHSFRRIILVNRTIKWRAIIKYRYFFKDDYTNTRMNESNEWNTLIKGPQRIRLIGFSGYVNFKPRFFWGSTIIYGYVLGIDWGTPIWP